MAGEIQIANLALLRINEPLLTSLETASKAADAFNASYPTERDALLREFTWQFAKFRVALNAEVTPPLGFAYAYRVPADFLALRALATDPAVFAHNPMGAVDLDFQIEGGMVLTDAATLYMLYTRRVTDVAEFDPLFVKALSLRLAPLLARALSSDKGDATVLGKEAEDAVKTARRAGAIEAAPLTLEAGNYSSGTGRLQRGPVIFPPAQRRA